MPNAVILCLANSKKLGGRCCAGLHIDGTGWLRLIYEANPISFLIEQAGGKATSCVDRILEIQPKELHARTPFVFGSHAVVERISKYHTDPHFSAERSPIFARRGLIRL